MCGGIRKRPSKVDAVPRPATDEDAYALRAAGAAWDDFCEALEERGKDLLRPTAPKSPVDLAEGHR